MDTKRDRISYAELENSRESGGSESRKNNIETNVTRAREFHIAIDLIDPNDTRDPALPGEISRTDARKDIGIVSAFLPFSRMSVVRRNERTKASERIIGGGAHQLKRRDDATPAVLR